MKEVTDPGLLSQLNGSGGKEVTDPSIISKLNSVVPSQPSGAQKEYKYWEDYVPGVPPVGEFMHGIHHEAGSVINAIREMISSPESRKALQEEINKQEELYKQSSAMSGGNAEKAGEIGAQLGEAAFPIGGAEGSIGKQLLKAASLGGGLGALHPTGQVQTSDFLKAKTEQAGLGAAAGVAGQGLGAGLSKFLSPVEGKVAPQIEKFADIAKNKFGFHISAGNQIEGKAGETIRNLENAGKFAAANQQKAQQAIARELGVNSNRLDEITLSAAYRQANSAYNKLTSDKPVKFDKEFFKGMSDVLNSEKSNITSLRNKQLEQTIDELKRIATTSRGGKVGELSPRQYQDLRSKLNDKAQAAFAAREGGLGKRYKELIEKIDDSVERSIPPQQKSAWEDARNKWRAWSVVRELAGKGEIESGTGQINMKSLADHMRQEYPDQWGGHTGGGSTFMDLAKVADSFPDAFQSTLKPKNLSPQEEMARMLKGVSPSTLAEKAAGKVTQYGANTPWGQKNLLQGTPGGQSLGTVVKKYPGLVPTILRSLGITSTEKKD